MPIAQIMNGKTCDCLWRSPHLAPSLVGREMGPFCLLRETSSPSPAALLRLNAIVGRLVYVAGFEIMTKWGVYAPECIRSGRHLLFHPQKKSSLRMNCRNNVSPPQNRLSPRTRLVNCRVFPRRKVLSTYDNSTCLLAVMP